MNIHEAYEPPYQWWDTSFDWFKEIGAAIGFDISDIYFSGFWSQGDGACFIGSIGYRKGWRAALVQVCSDSEVTAIAERWQSLQARCFYQLVGNVVKRHHRYSHENTVHIDCEDARDSWRELPKGAEDEANDIARDFMRWIYHQLEKEYEYQRAWQWANGWQETAESMKETRAEARQLVKDMRAAIKAGLAASPSICGALRSQLRSLIDRWESERKRRDELESEFHYWQDGKRWEIAEFASANL